MRLDHEYWCEPECTWQTNSINKTNENSHKWKTWASRLWRGIKLVFKSLDCFTVRPVFSTRPITRITRIKSFSFCVCVCVLGGSQLQCIYYSIFTIWCCCIPISMPPRVIRRFKRHSCFACCQLSTKLLSKPMMTNSQLHPKEFISVTFEWKYQYFH